MDDSRSPPTPYGDISNLLARMGGDTEGEYASIMRETLGARQLTIPHGGAEVWGDGGLPPTPPLNRLGDYGGGDGGGTSAASTFNYVPTQLVMPSAAPVMLSVDMDMPALLNNPPSEVNLVDVMEKLKIPSDVVKVEHLKAWILMELLSNAPPNLVTFDLIVSRPDPRRPGKQEHLYDHFEVYHHGAIDGNNGCIADRLRVELRGDRPRRNAEQRFEQFQAQQLEPEDMRDEARPEQPFHDALERLDNDMAPANTSSWKFLQECSEECRFRFEHVAHSHTEDGPGDVARKAAMAVGAGAGTLGRSMGELLRKAGEHAGVLSDEFATWELLADLHDYQLLDKEASDKEGAAAGWGLPVQLPQDPDALSLTDKEVVRQVLTPDRDLGVMPGEESLPGRVYPYSQQLLRCCVVKKWLERCYMTTAAFYAEGGAEGISSTGNVNQESRWAATAATLTASAAYGPGRQGSDDCQVKSLDPDAPIVAPPGRWLKLSRRDEEDERDLLLDVWRSVRGGSLDNAIDSCTERGSKWRAAMLAGGELHGPTLGSLAASSYPASNLEAGLNAAAMDGPGAIDEEQIGAYKRLYTLGLLRPDKPPGFLDNDPEGGNDSGDEPLGDWENDESNDGNPRRGLWLHMCWMLGSIGMSQESEASDSAAAVVEGTVCAALAGNVVSLLRSPLMKQSRRIWQDRCWAFFQSLAVCGVQEALEAHHRLQVKHTALFPAAAHDEDHRDGQQQLAPAASSTAMSVDFAAMSPAYDLGVASSPLQTDEQEHLRMVREGLAKATDTPLTMLGSGVLDAISMKTVFDCVSKDTPREAQKSHYNLVQAAAIIGPNALRGLLVVQPHERALPQLDVGVASPPYLRRFGAHLAILLRNVDVVEEGSAEDARCDELVHLYVQHLVADSFLDLVALYCKHIRDQRMRVDAYVQFMRGVKDGEERRTCLRRANECFPSDVAEITKKTVEQIRMETEGGDEAGHGDTGYGYTQMGVQQQQQPSMNPATPIQPLSISGARRPDFPPPQPTTMVSVALTFLQDDPLSGASSGALSKGEKKKISGIEWLCISEEHKDLKAEAVAQANELLREFFIGPAFFHQQTHGQRGTPLRKQQWRYHAADFLMNSSDYLSKDTDPFAFPTQVLKQMNTSPGGTAALIDGGVYRSPLEWARVLKEQQCWRVFLYALDSFARWKKAWSECPKPPEREEPPPSANLEEMQLQRKLKASRHIEDTYRWLKLCLEDQTGGGLEQKAAAAEDCLRMVLDFGDDCYGPLDLQREGEVDASVEMQDSLQRCGMTTYGWMLFDSDYLHPDAPSPSTGLQSGNEARRREADRDASTVIRQQCLPVMVLLLHELHSEMATWQLLAADHLKRNVPGLARRNDTYNKLRVRAANRLRESLQVADLAAARNTALYSVMDEGELKRLLADSHKSAMALLELSGGIDLRREPTGVL